MFSAGERERVRERLVAMAERDHRITAAALIGGSAAREVDRWSDLDLGLAVAAGTPPAGVIEDWTGLLQEEFGALHLFDVAHLSSVYRVFLFPGALQVDLSFTPETEFGALGPRFSLLFGRAVPREPRRAQPPEQVFGLAVHHTLRARICIERGRLWQAEHWISGVRDESLALACQRLGLEPSQGRGYDGLPASVLEAALPALVREITRVELIRSLGAAIDLLLSEGAAAAALAERLRPQLEELRSPEPLS